MNNFYLSNCSFERQPVVEDGEYSFDLEKKIEKLGEHIYSAVLTTTVIK